MLETTSYVGKGVTLVSMALSFVFRCREANCLESLGIVEQLPLCVKAVVMNILSVIPMVDGADHAGDVIWITTYCSA